MSNEFSLTSEQEKALNLNKDLLVLAGAGSGKTRVLTERYIHLVEKSIESNSPFTLEISWSLPLRKKLRER